MTARSLLKQWFSSKKKPTQAQFAEVFDSLFHKDEDSLPVAKVTGLSDALAGKASGASVVNEVIARAAADTELQNQINELAESPNLPAGGTSGQVLAKVDNTDGNAEWIDVTGGGSIADGLVSGGAASVVGSVLTIQAAVWRIDGTEYNTAEPQNFNLTAADAIHSRYDLIYGSSDGLHLLDGAASANPVKPTLPDNTVEVAFAFVQPGSISAGGVIPANYATKQDVMDITGDKALLATDAKSTLVAAVNEVNTKIGAINQESVILKIFKKSNYR